MVIDREILTMRETYKLGVNDELEIKSKGIKTEVYINGKKLEFILNVEFNPKPYEMVEIKIERAFMQDDFDRIKEYYI